MELLERRELLASYTTPEDTPLLVSDPNLASLHVVRAPLHGTVALTSAGGFAYTPLPNYFGLDSFTYVLATAASNTSTTELQEATITVTPVNDRPAAHADEYVTPRSTSLTVAAPGVLKNDKDVDNEHLKAAVVKLPEHGTLVLNENGSFTYTPAAGYTGQDAFTYKASDGTLSSEETKVALFVKSVPDARDDQYSVPQNGVLIVPPKGVLTNDVPVTDFGLIASLEPGEDHQPRHGTVELKGDGSFTYKPAAGYFGPDSFVYRATDATPRLAPSDPSTSPLPAAYDLARVWIYVRPSPLVVANPDVYTTHVNTLLTIERPGVLTNDQVFYAEPLPGSTTDAPSPIVNLPLMAVLLTNPPPTGLTFNADGSFKYQPPAEFQGTVTFRYQARLATTLAGDTAPPTDPNTARHDITTVTVVVQRPEPPPGPIARDDFFVAAANTKLSIGAPGVLRNDSPPVIQPVPTNTTEPILRPLSAVLITQPAHGNLVLNATGGFDYEPDPDFVGIDTFVYQASWQHPILDSTATAGDMAPILSNKATVTIRVVPALASADTYSTLQDTELTVPAPGVLGNDAGGSDEHPLEAVLVSEPVHGELKLNANGGFIYTPDPGFTGADVFVYRAETDLGAVDPALLGTNANDTRPIIEPPGNVAIVKIYVRAARPTVHAYPDRYVAAKNTELKIEQPGVLGNDYALVNHRVEASLAEGPAHGSVTVNADGSFTYVPATDFVGTDKFVYKATDLDGTTSNTAGTVNFSLATVTIVVQADSTLPKFLPGGDQQATDDSGRQIVPEWATFVALTGAGQPSFTVVIDKPQLFADLPSVDAAGQLSYTPAPNVYGEARVTVTLSEGVAADANASATFTIRIDKPYLLHNVVKQWDVTGDTNVAPDDALAVIDYLNAFRSQAVASGEDQAVSLYYDVDMDNFIAPSDALAVINYLNAQSPITNLAEGEAAVATDLSLVALMQEGEFDPVTGRKRVI